MKQLRYSISVLAFILMCASASAQDYEIFLSLDGSQAGTGAPGTGTETGTYYGGTYYDATTKTLHISFTFTGLITPATAAHIHGPALVTITAGVLIPFSPFPGATSGTYISSFVLDSTKESHLMTAKMYVNIHTSTFSGGEIRGQLFPGGLFPVELTSFTAFAKGRGVELAWKTATEVNNHGFEIERCAVGQMPQYGIPNNGTFLFDPSSGQAGTLVLQWEKVGFVEGHGTTNAPKEYSFTDNSVASGTYSYRLKQIDRDGQFEYSQEVEVMMSQVPQKFALMQNYPNPFNPSTQIRFAVPASRHGGQAGFISLKVYDVIGNEVASLVNGVIESGEHSVRFNASNLAAGVYFYTLRARQTAKNPAVKTEGGQAGDFSDTKKLVLVK